MGVIVDFETERFVREADDELLYSLYLMRCSRVGALIAFMNFSDIHEIGEETLAVAIDAEVRRRAQRGAGWAEELLIEEARL